MNQHILKVLSGKVSPEIFHQNIHSTNLKLYKDTAFLCGWGKGEWSVIPSAPLSIRKLAGRMLWALPNALCWAGSMFSGNKISLTFLGSEN